MSRKQTPLSCPECEKRRKQAVASYWNHKAQRDKAARDYARYLKQEKNQVP